MSTARPLHAYWFERDLAELRKRIENLPAHCRDELRAFADRAEELHRRMERTCRIMEDATADIGLALAEAQFSLAVWERELAHRPGRAGQPQ